MCWITREKKHSVKKIAEEDLKVFKICRQKLGKVYPYFFSGTNISYQEGKTYWQFRNPSLYWTSSGYYGIMKGFHSYSMDLSVENTLEYYYNTTFITLRISTPTKPLTSYSESISPNGAILCYVECTIPKGVAYYENEYGEIVSRKLRIDKITKIREEDCIEQKALL